MVAKELTHVFNFGYFFSVERRKYMTFKPLIFENFWGPEVVGSSSYQKNIGVKTHCVNRLLWSATTLATLMGIRVCQTLHKMENCQTALWNVL